MNTQNFVAHKKMLAVMDGTDRAILKEMSKNALIPALELSKILKKQKIYIKERGIRKRITSLKKK